MYSVVNPKTVHEQANDFEGWNRQSEETQCRFEGTAIPFCEVILDHVGNQ